MKKPDSIKEDINGNIVMFPSSKHFKSVAKYEMDKNDPLEELLKEFVVAPTEEDMPCDNSSDVLMQELESMANLSEVEILKKNIALLLESQARMKYYLDEIELFCPRRKK